MRALLTGIRRLVRSSSSSHHAPPIWRPPPPPGASSSPSWSPCSKHKLPGFAGSLETRHPGSAPAPCDFSRCLSLGLRRWLSFATGFSPLQLKPLGSIIDLDRARSCDHDELVSVWDDYHLGRGHIGASMKAKLFHLLEQRSASCQHFVLPLWKGSGYTNMFVQVQMPRMLFTGLEDYKARGTQASPYFVATHYTEFAESKDVVLIRGDVVFTSKLTDSEAKWLLETTQSFYLNDVRYKLVEQFNKETREFEFKNVLQALEMPVL